MFTKMVTNGLCLRRIKTGTEKVKQNGKELVCMCKMRINKTKYQLIIACAALLIFCCKKNAVQNKVEQPTVNTFKCDSNTNTFSVPLDNSSEFYDVCEDDRGNVLVLGLDAVKKFDSKGNLLWTQPIMINGAPQNVIPADDENIFITSSDVNIEPLGDAECFNPEPGRRQILLTSYIKAEPGISSACGPIYHRITKSISDPPDEYIVDNKLPENNSKCRLAKLGKNGNVIWTKTFAGNYFEGQSLAKSGDGNFFLLTHKLSGFYREVRNDVNGVFDDTLDISNNKNKIVLYKINGNGDVTWFRTYNNIIHDNAVSQNTPGPPGGARIAVTAERIFIQTLADLIIADANGNELLRIKPYGNNCNVQSSGLDTYDNKVYSSGFSTGGTPYVISYDANGSSAWKSTTTSQTVRGELLVTSDGFIQVENSKIAKYDFSGVRKWVKVLGSPGGPTLPVNLTCKEGILYIYYDGIEWRLVKADKDGNQ